MTKPVESNSAVNTLGSDAAGPPDANASHALSPSSSVSDETAVEPSDDPTSSKSEMITQNALALEAQVEERPLAKKQEQLESDDDAAEATAVADEDAGADPTHSDPPSEDHTKTKHHRKALLKNDDVELTRVGQVSSHLTTRLIYVKKLNLIKSFLTRFTNVSSICMTTKSRKIMLTNAESLLFIQKFLMT